ncbi:MAG: META domain-containing protein [Dechloromonas sp.]|nr:MAG: META domain-containing protein [Dechloromonas sp.]
MALAIMVAAEENAVRRLMILSTLCSLGLLACSGANETMRTDAKQSPQTAAQGDWQLTESDQLDAASIALAPPTLHIEDTRISGFDGCNRYLGQLQWQSDAVIAISGIAASKMGCEPARMAIETAYLEALRRATSLQVGATQLQLVTDAGERWHFERATSSQTE